MSKFDLAHLLKDLVVQTGLSKKALAEQAKISRQSLYNLLNGDISEVKVSTLVNLASALRVHPLELLRPYFNGYILDCDSRSSSNLIKGLNAGFIEDVTYPDYSSVSVNQTFDKTWLVINTGSVPWEDLYLVCQDEPCEIRGLCVGLKPQYRKIPIPYTLPGEKVELTVTLTAPVIPGSVRSEWKAENVQGQLVLGSKFPLYCLVKVVSL
ncbi:helix-turn-helix domain-containing protein [Thiomicrorhabdus sp. 6S2-11]|uniref:Helix-turn-helix domain-containing protein n=1 Tax=Thiomicrorhabdus marina TaxID=2818442 RepID=A0ABS3Q5H1_9GAMM|nr:NBR1-Ig-like domain-containing protein [Thiomicrorhabdus marina]MBO1927568.1 helix-turn-helix domain-containing protein [Thiomicrorhabdus marina]